MGIVLPLLVLGRKAATWPRSSPYWKKCYHKQTEWAKETRQVIWLFVDASRADGDAARRRVACHLSRDGEMYRFNLIVEPEKKVRM
jgi:hypothetical protein